MTPKEKAENLIFRFNVEADDYGTPHPKSLARQCALICCDEIIKVGEATLGTYYKDAKEDFETYWQQVKKEIERL